MEKDRRKNLSVSVVEKNNVIVSYASSSLATMKEKHNNPECRSSKRTFAEMAFL